MPDMYTFQSHKPASQSENDSLPQLTPNILPCRIHHDGPIDSVDRFWTPSTDATDNTHLSHFRGRKLQGRRVAIPAGYTGIVATPTERVSPQPVKNSSAADDVTELEEPVKILEMQGTFDEMMVWGHEVLPAADDPYVKGIEEWVRFAETMHGTSAPVNK